ncbi:unnamed protein product [Thlaspi arvense]|uniref:FRIGIDA-like protein n=1 Tax=Thlaspi arvense TaxID=13288 RepID=A0AAU9RNS5_THLAR|nr:unnamed protein product [Thlaspi arvense]
MEEIKVENELKLCGVKRENFRKAFEKINSQASDILVLCLQWSDIEATLKSAEEKIAKRLREVEAKEAELQNRSFALDERAKAVEAAETEAGELEMKSDGFRMEIEETSKDLDFLRNKVEVSQSEFITEEVRLTLLWKSVEECTAEQMSKTSQLNDMVESLRKTQAELDMKGEQLAQMETDLERHRVEVSAEKEHLEKTQTCVRELDEEIERKKNYLTSVQDKTAECEKLLGTRSSELVTKQKELKELSLDLDLTEETVLSLKNDMKETCEQVESKAKELKDIQMLIEDRSSHYESIKSLIEEHTEELASKEKRQNELKEAIRKLSLEIDSKQKTLERAKVFIEQLSEKQHSKEKKLDSTRRHLERCIKEWDSTKTELRSVKDTLRECVHNMDIKEKELKTLQSILTERNKQVEEAEKKMQHLNNSSEELIRQLKLKQEEVSLINKSVRECSGELEAKSKHCDEVQRSITDLTAELRSKESDLKKIQKSLKDAHSKEEQQVRLKESLMKREQGLVLKEKELDNKDQQLKSTEQKLAKSLKEIELRAKQLSSFCQQPDQQVDLVRDANVCDEKTLQLLLRGQMKKCHQLHLDVLRSLKASSDPAKLVLGTIQGLCSAHERTAETNLDLNSVRRSSICLLECLMDISPKPKAEVQGEAIKFATECKNTTLLKAENPVEVLGFLHFLAAFSLAYTFDADKVQNLFDVAFLRKYAPSLCEALGVSALVPVNNVLSLEDNPQQQPPEAPISNSSDSRSLSVQENVSSSIHLADDDALRDFEGSTSFSPNEVSTKLPMLKDPGRFVLTSVEDALAGVHRRGELVLAEPIVKTLVPLLEELARVVTSTDPDLQSDATKVAHQWSLMMGKSAQKSQLEAWAFLQFIVAYGLVKQTNQDETLQFASSVAHFKEAPKLFQSLGLSSAIPNFVNQLLNKALYIPAIRFMLSFNVKNNFSPLVFLKEEIMNLKRSAKEKRRFESQAEAAKLRDMIEIIKDFKLEIDLPVELIDKFMVPREIHTQNQCVVPSSVPIQSPPMLPRFHMQASHTVVPSSYLATHVSNQSHPTSLGASPNPQFLDVGTYQAGGLAAFQVQTSEHAGFKRPRMDPGGPRPTIRPCFNQPPPSYGRF